MNHDISLCDIRPYGYALQFFIQFYEFQDDGGRVYEKGNKYIKVSKAIVDRFERNNMLSSADEGLSLCVVLFNNKDCVTNTSNGSLQVCQEMRDFFKGDCGSLIISFLLYKTGNTF